MLFLFILAGTSTLQAAPEPFAFWRGQQDVLNDTFHAPSTGIVSVKDFFAMGDGNSDDYLPIMNACNYCIANPKSCSKVRFPAGFSYRIKKPLLLQNNGRYFSYPFYSVRYSDIF